jgi:DNA-directed RNA polymerase subunit beta'
MSDERITTPGALFIKSKLPTKSAQDAFDIYRPLDKGAITTLINVIIKHGGEKSYETISALTKLFFDRATSIGASTPMTDYENDSDERQAIFSEFEKFVQDVMNGPGDRKAKLLKLDEMAGKTRANLNDKNLKYLLGRGSVAAKMSATGARGNPSQLGIGTASPLMAFDVAGRPIPVVIKHSFAEGLSPAEAVAMSYGGRASTVLTQLSTEKPGALFKKLTPALFHEVITETDCGTKNGILIPTSDPKSIIGRYEAGTNHLIDEHEWNIVKGRKTIKMRSPMTCEAHQGLCQKCYGIAANGKLPSVGENVGVIASQSVSETLTQAMLSTKHTGGVSSGQRNAYEEANNLLSNPRENFQDESTIATINGRVSRITRTPLKDWEIFVNDKPHFVSREQEPVVHVGDNVRTGDALSTGTINPRKLVELKGAGAGRRYLADKLREVYTKRSPGLDPRHFELIAKNMIRYVQVEDPGESGYLPGQQISVEQLQRHLKDDNKNVKIENATGHTLANGVLELTPGTYLTANHVSDLKKAGITNVVVSTSGLKVAPIVPGLQTIKLADSNWVSNLSFTRLKDTIENAASTGVNPLYIVLTLSPHILWVQSLVKATRVNINVY